MDGEALERIRSNASFAIERFSTLVDFEFGYGRESVAWLEGFIDRQRLRGGDTSKLIGVIGSFLGEAIIASAGGVWTEAEQAYGVVFSAGDICFPFAKVSKQFENGTEGGDGILSFYDIAVDYVAKGKLGR